ncbi:unnamed protein product [Pelagomonas calceolata]|uniref:Uncharacterized protein n=1 Tax=Pelagomonas calceolata TaxID=35677 RepID=A0A8J2SYB6_9STRA|nr:unnamed protein product [Pelagomonas calceolata]
MMAAPPHLDAIAESPLKGCALLGSPVLDECEDNEFELFKARIDAADTAYELALEQSRFESRVEARRRASASARASAEARSEARAQHDDYFARQRLEDAIAGVKDLVGEVPDAVDDGLTPRSSLRRACDDAAAFLAEEAAEPALPSPGPRETDHSPPRTRTPVRTEEAAGDESDGSEDSGDGILAADYEGPGANRRGDVGAAPAPAADEDDDSSDWSSSAEAPAPAPLDDDDDISIVSVSSATAEDASERLERAEGYCERYPAKAAKVLRPCITAWRGGAPIDYASNPDVGPVLAVSCCYAYARATANVAVQDGNCGENSPALVADALEALDQALELDPSHAPSTRLRGRLLPLLGEALCPRRIRASFRPE